MKLAFENERSQGLTLVEVLVIIAVMVVLVGVLLPLLAKNTARSSGLNCVNNLKQAGLAARIFSIDNGDEFPWRVSTNTGGSMEYVNTPNSAFRHFQVMSNELSTPIVLVCPEDKRRIRASDWSSFSNANVSYFVGFEATETNAQSILFGDRHLLTKRRPTNGLLILNTNDSVGWTKDFHNASGYLAFGDGSVQSLSSIRLKEALCNSGTATNRWAIP